MLAGRQLRRVVVGDALLPGVAAIAGHVVGVAVDITVDEGPEFKLGNVRYAGAAVKQTKELDNLAKWRKDEVVNFDEVKTDVDRITRQFKSKGYLHAE